MRRPARLPRHSRNLLVRGRQSGQQRSAATLRCRDKGAFNMAHSKTASMISGLFLGVVAQRLPTCQASASIPSTSPAPTFALMPKVPAAAKVQLRTRSDQISSMAVADNLLGDPTTRRTMNSTFFTGCGQLFGTARSPCRRCGQPLPEFRLIHPDYSRERLILSGLVACWREAFPNDWTLIDSGYEPKIHECRCQRQL